MVEFVVFMFTLYNDNSVFNRFCSRVSYVCIRKHLAMLNVKAEQVIDLSSCTVCPTPIRRMQYNALPRVFAPLWSANGFASVENQTEVAFTIHIKIRPFQIVWPHFYYEIIRESKIRARGYKCSICRKKFHSKRKVTQTVVAFRKSWILIYNKINILLIFAYLFSHKSFFIFRFDSTCTRCTGRRVYVHEM